MANQVRDEQVLYDAKGRKTHVILPIKRYEEILERLEDKDDRRAIRETEREKSIPWKEARKRLLKKVI